MGWSAIVLAEEPDRSVLRYNHGNDYVQGSQGTKAKLRQLNRNVSGLLRHEVEKLLHRRSKGSAYEKVEGLCGAIKGGPRNAATSKAYLKQYAQNSAD
jgi:hypothetical protein